MRSFEIILVSGVKFLRRAKSQIIVVFPEWKIHRCAV
jgi:hypothetical protein